MLSGVERNENEKQTCLKVHLISVTAQNMKETIPERTAQRSLSPQGTR